VNESRAITAGALIGAVVGAAASYLFFTERGKQMRDRLEPAVDDLRSEFARFQKTVERLGEMANDGIRAVNEFNAARAQSSAFRGSPTSH
jgi:gas vesicle protein